MSDPQLKSDVDYQKDLKMHIEFWNSSDKEFDNEKNIIGIGVIRQAQKYKIRIDPLGKADAIILQSCHRQWRTPHPKRRGGWFSKKYYEFFIEPTKEHEVNKACSFDIGVFEKEKGRHGWGLLVIDSNRAKLKALVKCNGQTNSFGGTSVCQSKAGLIQSIHFDRPVTIASTKNCKIKNIKKPINKKDWIFLMPAKECITFFVDDKNADVFHKAVWFGYDKIPIRGVD